MRQFNKREKSIITKMVQYESEYNGMMYVFREKYIYDHAKNLGVLLDFEHTYLFLLVPRESGNAKSSINEFFEVLSLVDYLREERFISVYSVTDDPEFANDQFYVIGQPFDRYGEGTHSVVYQSSLDDPPYGIEKESEEATHIAMHIGNECYKYAIKNFITQFYISEDLKDLVRDNFVTWEEKRFRKQYLLTWGGLIVALLVGVISIIIQLIK